MLEVPVIIRAFSRFQEDSMPIYEYRCGSCGHQGEFLQKISDDPIKFCPTCGKDTFAKMLSAAGFHLKGSGWYATDFKNGSKGANTANEKPKEESKSSDDAKPAAGCGGPCACH
jgi:putative FmdB family regulatory protein